MPTDISIVALDLELLCLWLSPRNPIDHLQRRRRQQSGSGIERFPIVLVIQGFRKSVLGWVRTTFTTRGSAAEARKRLPKAVQSFASTDVAFFLQEFDFLNNFMYRLHNDIGLLARNEMATAGFAEFSVVRTTSKVYLQGMPIHCEPIRFC